MFRFACAVACVAMLGSSAMAQNLEVGCSIGFGLATGGMSDVGGMGGVANTERNATAFTKFEEIYPSMGNGLKINLDGTYFLNENVGVMLATGYSTMGGFTSKDVYPTGSTEVELNGSYIPVNVGLKLRAKLGSVSPYVFAAPGIYLCSTTGEVTATGAPKEELTAKYSMGFGFSSGMGVLLALNEKMGIKIELNPNYAFANMTELESKSGSMTSTTIYKNNEPTLPVDVTTPTSETSYEHGQPRTSFSSFSANVGISLAF